MPWGRCKRAARPARGRNCLPRRAARGSAANWRAACPWACVHYARIFSMPLPPQRTGPSACGGRADRTTLIRCSWSFPACRRRRRFQPCCAMHQPRWRVLLPIAHSPVRPVLEHARDALRDTLALHVSQPPRCDPHGQRGFLSRSTRRRPLGDRRWDGRSSGRTGGERHDCTHAGGCSGRVVRGRRRDSQSASGLHE